MDRTEPNSSGRDRISTSGPRTFTRYREQAGMMHQPQQLDSFGNDRSRYLQSARLAWHELTEYELLKSLGSPGMLIRLVQERYAITYDEAQRQVKGFFDTHKF